MDAELVNAIREKYAALEPFLNERTKRLWAAVEAKALGRGGKAWVAAAIQLSRTTLYRALRELDQSLEAVSDSRFAKVSDEEVNKVNIRRARFHGEWNYKIVPKCSS